MSENMGDEITINGEKTLWAAPEISYEQLVELAGMKGTPSAMYEGPRHGDSQRSGIMHPGKIVAVEDGMHFSVAHTNNA